MPTSPELDKPSPNAYPEWLRRNYDIDLLGGNQELWHDTITPGLRDQFMQSPFWRTLVDQLSDWNDEYRAENSDYGLLHGTSAPDLCIKPYSSAVEKSFRWNVVQNKRWPSPPIAPTEEELARATRSEEAGNWYHPGNWLHHFPDIIRTRLTVVYLDGVTVLANKLSRSAEELGIVPETRFQAQPDGYHAVHVLIGHTFNTFDFDSAAAVTVPAKVEIQIRTQIQETISPLLHGVYEQWRLEESAPQGWQWDYDSPAFAINYLGHTLHYLEGMIVAARKRLELI